MKTITLCQPGQFQLSDTPAPAAPRAGEALVRVHRVGICGTDMHAFRGKQPFFSYPRIVGHELGVSVEAVGPGVANVAVGDRCSVEPYMNCGKCIACRRGKGNCCTHLQVLGVHTDGGMRERIIIPAHKLHRSKKLSFDQLALVETLGIGCHAVSRGNPEKGENVLVIGAGPIGLSVMQFARAAGARVIAMDINAERLDFCQRQIKVDLVINSQADPLPQIMAATGNDLPTTVFDATGHPQSMASAFQCVAPGGKLIFVGLVQADITFNDPHFHRREMTLFATRNAAPADFARIIQLVENGAVDTTPWITHRCPADAMIDQFPRWLDPAQKCLKAVVEF